ncbi:protein PTST homolog 2, chloroplastic [Bidens hawaiensis]|uniref:protein PTST homolog 2, chloroplastic n=1 Tax=Bidens hawaiensis TaxID=980011 RepID=UPI00404AD6FC
MPCRLSSPHLISTLLVGLNNNNNNNNNFNKISSRRISSFKLVRRRPLDCRARPSGEEEGDSEGGLELEKELLVFMKNNSSLEFPTRKQLLDAGRTDLVNAISNTRGWLTLGWDYEEEHDFTNTNHFTQNHHTSSLEEMLLPQEEEEDTGGVHGILNRLEKHRSSSFNIHMHKDKNKQQPASSSTTHVGGAAAKIDSQRRNKDLSPDDITTRLQHMQLELSSAIHSLRSKSSHTEVHESCGTELQQLSDVWEFQENEAIKAGDKLRSIRAKLAVLQGKIALSVTDTHKLVEEKQRRIDSARATLQLLRTTCIFWSHSASEVLLVGSFDGWTSKIKMEKTKTGVFCASLKLYPGRYEIKFIVDGTWRVDPMLPVVHNNGYENNILVVHESA